MKKKASWLAVFLLAILWGVHSCGTVQIVSEKKSTPEPVRQGKTAPEKTTPKGQSPPEASAEKSFLERIYQKIVPPDSFSRTYPVDFAVFHPKANSALQDYARTRKGNSFQISRLGSNEVVLRGVYLREGTQERYATTLFVRPAGPKQSQLEIKMGPAAEGAPSGNPEAAANEIFLIIEKSAGTRTP
ncbi:MAG: hypothetical protein H6Q42_2479 [Deltaproteobacteria bacterium]|nr:hypothetical protein [Deltaproteobacteria bacterium]